MRLGGLLKMTLLDFPGRIACTVFTAGCNFRCPFCHNASLVTHLDEEIAVDDFFSFLKKRQGMLDGVCVSGGEPLMQPEMADFLRNIRALGYATKIDTNGAYPDKLRALIEGGLVDYVAMDIKNSPAKYAQTIGLSSVPAGVEESVSLLRSGIVPYEFRTTVVDELHEPEDFAAIGQWIAGAPRYFLQKFTDSGDLIGEGLSAPSNEKLRACLAAVAPYVPSASLRGVD
jgi:pyruvate formate lyase activating enzyme